MEFLSQPMDSVGAALLTRESHRILDSAYCSAYFADQL